MPELQEGTLRFSYAGLKTQTADLPLFHAHLAGRGGHRYIASDHRGHLVVEVGLPVGLPVGPPAPGGPEWNRRPTLPRRLAAQHPLSGWSAINYRLHLKRRGAGDWTAGCAGQSRTGEPRAPDAGPPGVAALGAL